MSMPHDSEECPATDVGLVDSYWRMIAESIPHIVWMASPDGQLDYLNQRGADYTGWSPGSRSTRFGRR